MTVIAVAIVLVIAAAITWLSTVITERRRETNNATSPISQRALQQLGQTPNERNGTRW